MATKKKAKAADKGGDEAATPAGDGVHDAAYPGMSYKQISDATDDPVVPVTRVIPRTAAEEPDKGDLWPDMVVTTEVIWGPLPKDPPPKPNRVAATIKDEVMSPVRDRPKKVPSIGSMTPYFGKK